MEETPQWFGVKIFELQRDFANTYGARLLRVERDLFGEYGEDALSRQVFLLKVIVFALLAENILAFVLLIVLLVAFSIHAY